MIKAFKKRPEDGSLTPAIAGWLDQIWQLIKSDVYTPTLFNTTNIGVGGSTAFELPYQRVGDVVTVGIRFAANPTTGGAGTDTELGMSLPIPSVFTQESDACGDFSASAIQQSGRILADTTNNRLALRWFATDNSNRAFSGVVTYRIK